MDTKHTTDLQPHPFNVKVYGKIDWTLPINKEFLQSITNFGIRQPITYTRLSFDDGKSYGNYIVSGHRRWEAANRLGLAKVPVHIWGSSTGLKDTASLLAAELFVVDANRQRVKTSIQKGREFAELKRIETALAKERQKQGKANLPDPKQAGQARDRAADAVGLKPRTADKLEKLVIAADSGDADAKAALVEIDRKGGRGVDTAYRNVVQAAPIAQKPIVKPWDLLVKDDRPERTGHVGKLVVAFADSDLRGSLQPAAVGDPIADTMNRFNLIVHTDGAGLKKLRSVVGTAQAVKFYGLTAKQVEMIAEAFKS